MAHVSLVGSWLLVALDRNYKNWIFALHYYSSEIIGSAQQYWLFMFVFWIWCQWEWCYLCYVAEWYIVDVVDGCSAKILKYYMRYCWCFTVLLESGCSHVSAVWSGVTWLFWQRRCCHSDARPRLQSFPGSSSCCYLERLGGVGRCVRPCWQRRQSHRLIEDVLSWAAHHQGHLGPCQEAQGCSS